MALNDMLNKILYGVLFMSNVLPTWMQGYIEKKRSRFLWKVGLLGLSSKKCAFCMQIFWSNTLEGLMKNRFHAKFDPNNFRHCDVGLWTKYIYGIALHIFPIVLLIHDWKWWCKMELFDIHPYWNVWQQKLNSNKK